MWLYRLNFDLLGGVFARYWRLRLRGAVDRVPVHGPVLVTSNHESFLDPWLISMVFPRRVRYLITSTWYYRSPVWEAFFRAYGGIPVADVPSATIDAVHDRIVAGDVVGVFPEGKISHDGRIQPFKSGVARIASRTGAPVVPLGIRGSFESIPRTRRIPRPTRVEIHVGEPMTYAETTGFARPCRPGHLAFTNELFRRTRALAGQTSGADVATAAEESVPPPGAAARTAGEERGTG